MKNKSGKSEIETIFGVVLFIVIMLIFISSGIFQDIIKAFNIPEFGGYGLILGILFVLIIIVAFLDKILGK